MAFLTPIFLLLGFIAIPIIVLYMLRLRRKEMVVSSSLLWQRLLRDVQANAPWQRLKRNLLLILQLLILLALVLALGRPFVPVQSVVSGSVVVLLDGSASMQANDVLPNRFESAKDQVKEAIADLGSDDQMTLILAGNRPEVLASSTGDKQELSLALEKAAVGNSTADWESALALAAGAAQGFEESRIIIVSDGGLPRQLPSMPSEVVYIPIGTRGENTAILSLATRESVSGVQLYGLVSNFGQQDQEVLLSVDIDGQLFDSKWIQIEAGGESSQVWDLPEGAVEISAQLSNQESDYFPLDDRAWAVNEGGSGQRILLVGEGNRFLETVVSLIPGVELFQAEAAELNMEEGGELYDLIIYDGAVWPDPVPTGQIVMIRPDPPPLELSDSDLSLTYTGSFSNTEMVRLSESPILQYVDWSNINIREASGYSAPWLKTLVAGEGGPLLMAGEENGRRTVILTFRLQDSDLPLQIAFPILMANILEWLNPGKVIDDSVGLYPGRPVSLSPGPTANAVTITKPDGDSWFRDTGEEQLTFTESHQPGIYRISLRSTEGDLAAGSFAVNLFSLEESNIRPAETLKLGLSEVSSREDENLGQRELWPWLAGAAIVILTMEWWIFHRGGVDLKVPRLRALFPRSGHR